MELYEKIRNIRERQEIKQKEMARYLHMQPTTYNAYENGKKSNNSRYTKKYMLNIKSQFRWITWNKHQKTL